MNQKVIQIQKQRKEQKIIDKGFNLALLNHVRQTSNPNIFIVNSQSSPKFYRVLVDCDLDIVTCDCAYYRTLAKTCKHQIAVCFYMDSSKRGGD